jgi:uncharacterized protein (DUF1501 family)
MMNRRNLFTYAGAATAVGMLSRARRIVAAPSPQPKRLIMVLAQGGWDTTYALDPKEPGPSADIPAGAIHTFGKLDVFTDASRPNVTAYFTKYAANTAVVRGISVASVAHVECLKRMATGTRNEMNPDMGAMIAHDNGNDLPMPYLILGDTAYAGPYAVSAGRVGPTNQLVTVLDPVTTNAEDTILQRYATATADRMRSTRGAIGYNRKRVDDFAQSVRRGKQLQAVRDGFGARGRTLALTAQVDLALDALQRDISQSVMINTRLGWDTHDTNTDQAGFHETTFAGLTRLLDGLAARPGRAAGSKMIDDTVVVCFSEFARTPKLNANAGKDHWPVTSALVIGGGVKGGQGYGATTAGIEAAKIDFATGTRSATGRALTSTHFVAGVLTLCGADAAGHLEATEVFDAFVA